LTRVCLPETFSRAARTRFVRAALTFGKMLGTKISIAAERRSVSHNAHENRGASPEKHRHDSIFGRIAAHGVTQKPTLPINQSFRSI
jgi:hypothetical protein